MKRSHGLPLFAVLAALVVSGLGCTPSPEQTCEKLEKLSEEAKGSKFKLSMSKCLKNMNEMKERDPKAYSCAAKVVKGTKELDIAFMAISMCDPGKKKAKVGDDDDDKGSKKKSKGDDD